MQIQFQTAIDPGKTCTRTTQLAAGFHGKRPSRDGIHCEGTYGIQQAYGEAA
jgi:hypothetical protein